MKKILFFRVLGKYSNYGGTGDFQKAGFRFRFRFQFFGFDTFDCTLAFDGLTTSSRSHSILTPLP